MQNEVVDTITVFKSIISYQGSTVVVNVHHGLYHKQWPYLG